MHRMELLLINLQFLEYYRKADIRLPTIYQEMDVAKWRQQRDQVNERELLHVPQEQRQPLIEVAADEENKHLVIKGDVGSGKTVFTDYLAAQIAATHLPEQNVLDNFPTVFRARLPVVRLRLRASVQSLRGQVNTQHLLLEVIRNDIEKLCNHAIDQHCWTTFSKDLLEYGVIILDGLDEVPKADGLRATLFDGIDSLKARLGKDARLMITSRPYVFEDELQHLAGFEYVELLPMRNEQVLQFIQTWYLLMRKNRGWGENLAINKADELYTQLLERDYLLEPSRRPLLLTLLTSLHFASDVLPHSRAQLYRQAIELMLERWTQRALSENPDYPLDDFERKALEQSAPDRKAALQSLAFRANKNQTLQFDENEINGLFSGHLLVDCNAKNLLDFIRFRSGILKAGQNNQFEFYHRSFQDYLAALAITDQGDWQDEIETLLSSDNGQDWWGEAFLLLVSIKIDGNSKPDAVALLRRFIPEQIDYMRLSEQGWRLFFQAAKAVIEQQHVLTGYYQVNPYYRKLYDDLQRHLLSLVQANHDVDINIRASAGRRLGELGDPRPGVSVIRGDKGKAVTVKTRQIEHAIPDITWVNIPAGCFTMGSADDDNQAYDAEKPAHSVNVKGFCMSAYLVTNAQYRCFIDAGGYEEERYWQKPNTALNWLRGELPDLTLLDDLDDDIKNHIQIGYWRISNTTSRVSVRNGSGITPIIRLLE